MAIEYIKGGGRRIPIRRGKRGNGIFAVLMGAGRAALSAGKNLAKQGVSYA
jgi:hypothetical protein